MSPYPVGKRVCPRFLPAPVLADLGADLLPSKFVNITNTPITPRHGSTKNLIPWHSELFCSVSHLRVGNCQNKGTSTHSGHFSCLFSNASLPSSKYFPFTCWQFSDCIRILCTYALLAFQIIFPPAFCRLIFLHSKPFVSNSSISTTRNVRTVRHILN